MKHRNLFIGLLLLAALLVAACGLTGVPTAGAPDSADALYTQAAQTVQAQLTQQAFATLVAQLTQVAGNPTAVPATVTPAPAVTATSVQPTPTNIPPTATPTQVPPAPTNTPVPIPCDRAEFVKDVTIPDGAVFSPGSEFTKTWRVKNTGSCNWDSGYDLVLVDGDDLDGDTSIPLPGRVRPGESVDLSVDLLAPSREGRYRGLWMLRNADGRVFGIGADARSAFWVAIRVISAVNEDYAYDLAGNFCSADWSSSAGDLPCPGSSSGDDGSVIYLDNPELENRSENEPALWVRPEATNGGWIQGVFPAYEVRAGDHFVSDVGCLSESDGCDVTFSLDYQIGRGSVQNLGSWHEVYDGKTTRIDVDLSGLSGESVKLILSVTANSRPSRADAFWLVPSIRRGTPPGNDNPAAQAARQSLAQGLGVDVNAVTVGSVEAREWTDSCLGVHLPDQVCSEVLIPGFRVILSANNRQYEAHTNQDGSIVFWFEI